MRFHAKKLQSRKLEFSQIEIETTSGWYGQSVETEKGLYFRTAYSNSQEREPSDFVQWMYQGVTSDPR